MIMEVTTFKLKGNILTKVGLDLISPTIHLEGYLLDCSTITPQGHGLSLNQGTGAEPHVDIDHPAWCASLLGCHPIDPTLFLLSEHPCSCC